MSSRKIDGRWHHRIHQSDLNGFLKCPEQGRADYRGELTGGLTDSLVKGSAAHVGIESLLLTKMEGIDEPSYDAAMTATEEYIDARSWRRTKMSDQRVYELALQAVHTFYYDVLPEVQPAEIEGKFSHVVYEDPGRVIEIAGRTDCRDVRDFVWDWKTSGRPYERWEHQRWAVQPTFYLWDANEDDTRWFRYAILLDDGSVQLLDVWRSQEHQDWLLRQLHSYTRLIETNPDGPWPLNDQGWWCHPRWCGKFDECKGEHMPDDWTERRPR